MTDTQTNYPPVIELVPHEPPLLLLSRVVDFDDESITCEVDLEANQMFDDGSGIDLIVATEWMAQSVGAYVGVKKRETGQAPRIGFIIGVRKVDFKLSKVKKGTELHVSAKPVWVDQASGSFECKVRDVNENRVIAEGSLTVHEPEE